MVQYIKQGNIFGRIGSSIGQGLAEQIPKEVERNRLSSGLKAIGENKDLDPYQRFAETVGVAHEYPQIIQSAGELSRQQARGQALSKFGETQNQPKPNPFKQEKPNVNVNVENKPPSLTKEETFAKAQEGFVPRTEEQKMQSAGERFNANPEIYANDPQKALDYEDKVDATNSNIAKTNQTKHANLTTLQDNVVNRLQGQYEKLGANVPSNVYSDIEDEAVQATKPKSEGGQGLTEDQAKKVYGKKLDEISREYQEIESIGNWGITGRKAKDTLQTYKALQKKFEFRDDTKNLADKIVATNKTSYPFAYSVAQPISNEPKLAHNLRSIPKVPSKFEQGYYQHVEKKDISNKFPELAKSLGEKGSPLAVGYELKKKGYDSIPWYDYLLKNSDNLKKFQVDQLEKTRNEFSPLNDYWLSEWSGLED